MSTETVDVVFDGPPGPESGRFIEVEDRFGRSVRLGEWVERDDGYWVLRIEVPTKDIVRASMNEHLCFDGTVGEGTREECCIAKWHEGAALVDKIMEEKS